MDIDADFFHVLIGPLFLIGHSYLKKCLDVLPVLTIDYLVFLSKLFKFLMYSGF